MTSCIMTFCDLPVLMVSYYLWPHFLCNAYSNSIFSYNFILFDYCYLEKLISHVDCCWFLTTKKVYYLFWSNFYIFCHLVVSVSYLTLWQSTLHPLGLFVLSDHTSSISLYNYLLWLATLYSQTLTTLYGHYVSDFLLSHTINCLLS